MDDKDDGPAHVAGAKVGPDGAGKLELGPVALRALSRYYTFLLSTIEREDDTPEQPQEVTVGQHGQTT